MDVHFERPTEQGFDSARCVLPSYEWKFTHGYSEDEIARFEELLRNNAHLIYTNYEPLTTQFTHFLSELFPVSAHFSILPASSVSPCIMMKLRLWKISSAVRRSKRRDIIARCWDMITPVHILREPWSGTLQVL